MMERESMMERDELSDGMTEQIVILYLEKFRQKRDCCVVIFIVPTLLRQSRQNALSKREGDEVR